MFSLRLIGDVHIVLQFGQPLLHHSRRPLLPHCCSVSSACYWMYDIAFLCGFHIHAAVVQCGCMMQRSPVCWMLASVDALPESAYLPNLISSVLDSVRPSRGPSCMLPKAYQPVPADAQHLTRGHQAHCIANHTPLTL